MKSVGHRKIDSDFSINFEKLLRAYDIINGNKRPVSTLLRIRTSRRNESSFLAPTNGNYNTRLAFFNDISEPNNNQTISSRKLKVISKPKEYKKNTIVKNWKVLSKTYQTAAAVHIKRVESHNSSRKGNIRIASRRRSAKNWFVICGHSITPFKSESEQKDISSPRITSAISRHSKRKGLIQEIIQIPRVRIMKKITCDFSQKIKKYKDEFTQTNTPTSLQVKVLFEI